jgi:hypothetical protein
MATQRKMLGLVAALLFSLVCCSPPAIEPPITRLSSDLGPLRTQFNQDAGKVRLLLLLDPT